jgi:hypothetical protein
MSKNSFHFIWVTTLLLVACAPESSTSSTGGYRGASTSRGEGNSLGDVQNNQEDTTQQQDTGGANPTPASTAQTQNASANTVMGVVFSGDFYDKNNASSASIAQQMQRRGWVVEQLYAIRDGRDVEGWANQHADVACATQQNANLIIRFDYKQGQTVPTPGEVGVFSGPVVRLVQAIASRCPNNPTRHFIIGNEPNVNRGRESGRGECAENASACEPGNYAQVYNAMRNAIRGAMGQAVVIAAAPSPSQSDVSMLAINFYSAVNSAVSVDAWGIHAYRTASNNSVATVLNTLAPSTAGKDLYLDELMYYENNVPQRTPAAVNEAYNDVRAFNRNGGRVRAATWYTYRGDYGKDGVQLQGQSGWNRFTEIARGSSEY